MSKYKFIDLFAGIGGFRLAFERAGFECVWSSEWDKFAQQTYASNFNEMPAGDVTKIEVRDIPEHDVLIAGFPCQPFSISGVSKRRSLNRPDGFDDPTQGTLFFEIMRIVIEKKPLALVLENVKHLENHDRGRTFAVIMNSLHEAGYQTQFRVLNASEFVPQHRRRVFIVGFRKSVPFEFPNFSDEGPSLRNILEDKVDSKYTLSNKLWRYLQEYKAKHRAAGNGFGYGLVGPDDTTRTLSARYYKDGSEILLAQEGRNPRRLTPRECARLMGFPESFRIPVSDTQAYKQFGNAVVVPVAEAVAQRVLKALREGERIYGRSFTPVPIQGVLDTAHA